MNEAREYPKRIWAGHLGGGRRIWKPELMHESQKAFACQYVRADIADQAIEALRRLRQTARLLQQNSEGCAVNHYGDDLQIHGLPGWLADTLADIEAAETAIALVDEAQSKAAGK